MKLAFMIQNLYNFNRHMIFEPVWKRFYSIPEIMSKSHSVKNLSEFNNTVIEVFLPKCNVILQHSMCCNFKTNDGDAS